MEYFGSDAATTRAASLDAINDCELYIGIIGGRYGSGIMEAEYDAARVRHLPCFVYVKAAVSIREEERDKEPEKRALLERLKQKLRDQQTGHLVSEFATPGELVVLVAANLHNWLFERRLSPVLASARAGTLAEDETRALGDALDRFADLHRQLLEVVSVEAQVPQETRRQALDMLYKLTYDAREQLKRVPGMEERREEIASSNLRVLERLVAASAQDHEALRELAVNWRLVAETRVERKDWNGARAAFQKSGDACAKLLKLAPQNALYQRDYAISHYNVGCMYESQSVPDEKAALREYKSALPSAKRAAKLDSRWQGELDQIQTAVARLRRA